MNSRTTRTTVILTLGIALALLTVTIVYAYSSRVTQPSAAYESDDYLENCEDFMDAEINGNASFAEHHGMLHEDGEEQVIGGHGCH